MHPEPALLADFSLSLLRIWRKRSSRIGLAVSGGVDSMALASLASIARKNANEASTSEQKGKAGLVIPKITGFIVDHKLRNGSTAEANRVAEILQRLDIEPCILTLDWTGHLERSSTSNLESVARTLRYRALGVACRDRNIRALLLAHHADDQAETVMSRISSGYLGSGLGGIRAEAPLPNCHGVFGVSESGRPARNLDKARGIQIEDGGVTVCRPLLQASKSDLIDVCKSLQTEWFEDETNTDRTLTVRNTIRHLLETGDLPVALRRTRLLQLSEQAERREQRLEEMASKCMEQTPVELDPRCGTAQFNGVKLGEAMKSEIQREIGGPGAWAPLTKNVLHNSLSAHVIRKLFAFVTHKESIALQDLDFGVDLIPVISAKGKRFDGKNKESMQISSITLDLKKNSWPLLSRGSPSLLERQRQILTIPTPRSASDSQETSMWSDWILWDGRYWIRLSLPPNWPPRENEVIIRFLEEEDLIHIRDYDKHLRAKVKQFNKILTLAPGDLRFTLPALAVRNLAGNASELQRTKGEVVALPSLGWSLDYWPGFDSGRQRFDWKYEIRYKRVGKFRSQ